MNLSVTITNTVETYSNALLAFLLLQANDFAHKSGITHSTYGLQEVKNFSPFDSDVGGGILFKDGCDFMFSDGHVVLFSTPRSFYGLQDPRKIASYYGNLVLSEQEVIARARQVLTNIGVNLGGVYADLKPEIELPGRIGTNAIPHFKVSWLEPNAPFPIPTSEIEIDGENGAVESIFLPYRGLSRAPPMLPGMPDAPTNSFDRPLTSRTVELSPGEVLAVKRAIKVLRLPFLQVFSTNDVQGVSVDGITGIQFTRINLKSGVEFTLMNGEFAGFSAADSFFNRKQSVRISDFSGVAKITDSEAADLARKALVSVGVPADLIKEAPQAIIRPFGEARHLVPRFLVSWERKDAFVLAQVEIDGESKVVKSLTLR